MPNWTDDEGRDHFGEPSHLDYQTKRLLEQQERFRREVELRERLQQKKRESRP